jgi:hypothetical protein
LSKNSIPVGIPQDYRELFGCYRAVIEASAKKLGLSCADVLRSLREKRTIEDFDFRRHAPNTFNRDEVLLYMGLNSSQWKTLFKATRIPVSSGTSRTMPWWRQRPLQINGDGGYAKTDALNTIYWAPDIIRMRDSLGEHVPVPRPICHRLVRSFRARLGQMLSRVRAPRPSSLKPPTSIKSELDKPLSAKLSSWPSDLPKNPEEMMTLYGDYVVGQVRRISKIRTEEELREVVQYTWEVILSSDVLGKFVLSAQTKLPSTLTFEETLGYLGVTKVQWSNALAYRQSRNMWMPIPVKGSIGTGDLYLTSDVQTLDESSFLKNRRTQPRKHPEVSNRGFKSYLGMAISNHFKNLLRTRSRRHKERCLDSTTTLIPSSTGDYHRTYNEEGGSWEDSLVSVQHCDMESLLDMASEMRRKGINPLSDEGHLILDHMTRRGMTINMAIRSASQG